MTQHPASPPRLDTPNFEARAARLILLVFLAAICLPYAFVALVVPPNLVWSGLIFHVDDQNVHLMWARQAQDGAFFMRNLFTTESLISGERPLFFNLLPWVMGIAARVTGLEVVWFYHIIRVAAAGLGLWQFHLLARTVTRDEARYSRARVLALCLVAFTTGAGFLKTLAPQLVNYYDFIDRPEGPFPMMPEAFFALSALIFPLNAVSMALLALIIRLVLEKRGAGAIFFSALILANVHTYDALPLLGMMAIWAAWSLRGGDKASAKMGAAAILGAMLPVLYQYFVFRGSEEFRIKALTHTPPPPFIHLVVSFLPLLIFMAFSRPASRDLPATRLLWVWIVTVFALIYVPPTIFPFARKMIEGVHLPMCLLAGLGLSALLGDLPAPRTRRLVASAILLLLMLSPLNVLRWIGESAIENNASRWQYFVAPLSITQGEAGALRALDAQQGQGAVLSLPFLGTYVPRTTGKVTYFGHWAETLHFGDKLRRVANFYQGRMSPAQAREFLVRNRIRWVVEGPFERNFADGASTPSQLGLRPIFRGGDAETGMTTVYEVS